MGNMSIAGMLRAGRGRGSMRALRAGGRNGMAVAGSAGVGEKERGGSGTVVARPGQRGAEELEAMRRRRG